MKRLKKRARVKGYITLAVRRDFNRSLVWPQRKLNKAIIEMDEAIRNAALRNKNVFVVPGPIELMTPYVCLSLKHKRVSRGVQIMMNRKD